MRFKAVKDVFVIEKVEEDPSEFPREDKKHQVNITKTIYRKMLMVTSDTAIGI